MVLLLFALCIASSCASVTPAPVTAKRSSTIELTSCTFAKHQEAALCGKHQVYENRAAKTGRRIALKIVILPALSAAAKADAVFYLAGGPGQGAARIASAGEDTIMRELRRERDLVFVDMRGTGDSNGLQCRFPADRTSIQSFFAELFGPSVVQACRETLEQYADLRLYTTPIGIDDLEEIRIALGYDKINLYGISHGTLAALEYLRRYSYHVRVTVLAGVATPAAKIPLQFAGGAQRAMTRLLHDCAADEACATAYPHLAYTFASLMDSFQAGFVTFEAVHPVSKAMQTVTLSHGVFVRQLLTFLYSHRSARLLPLIIDSAAKGNRSPYVRVLMTAPLAPEFSVYLGAYFSATCAESLPFIDERESKRATADTFIGDHRTRRHQQACAHWPRGRIDQDYYQPVRATTAVLMLSGDIDPATPAEIGKAALGYLPNGRQIMLRNTPHSYTSKCARNIIAEFIAKGSARELTVACAARLRRPLFATELPARYDR